MIHLERACRFFGLLTLFSALAIAIAVGAAGLTVAVAKAVT